MQIGVETYKAVDQRRVFVVDEDDITRTAIQFMLTDEIETHELSSPEEAIARKADGLDPDLIMLGVSFIKTRGTELISELTGHFKDARVMIVTDLEDEKTAITALKAGAHAALVKPLKIEAVRQKVDTVLGRSGAAPLIQLGSF
ncbi:response regulator [Thalassospira sp. MA62]|nr:response regulator [Thalassospira sp. MA62]